MFRSMRPSPDMNVCNLKLSGIHYKNIVIGTQDCARSTYSFYPAAQTMTLNHQFVKQPLDLRMLKSHLNLNWPNGSPEPRKMQRL